MSDRPETGSMRFGDDWRGVFLRGDNAHGYAGFLRRACAQLRKTRDHDQLLPRVLDGFARLLDTSVETGDDVTPLANPHLRPFAECVRDDGEAHAAHLDEIVAQRNLAVAQAVAAEREACAKVLDEGSDEAHAAGTLAAQHGHHNDARAYDRLAAELDARVSMIRARGKVTP